MTIITNLMRITYQYIISEIIRVGSLLGSFLMSLILMI